MIVPVGSKGGFVVRRPPPLIEGRQAVLAEGIECYRTFISGLLDVTDNLEGEEVVPPPAVRRRDDDDPYLVVAADKGTATFSDIANQLAKSYDFWLDDAFASGGSAGYDHKKMGITARGVWESVKRHFRELGKDIQSGDFTCVAVGDMGGDVFGNGMLLSKHTRLIGAFNHLHIFVDPDPDPETSWAERRRLFDATAGWNEYDSSLISAGGGIFSRSAKSVPVSAEMRRVFGLDRTVVTPNELIRAMLSARMELLFFGGIGTFVKSRSESHAAVGDRTNDSLRVDADEVKAKVVGEGANLAMTQLARISYSLRGGRCNTDFIDNSAGVDCSDHEVNIKILLGGVERAGDLTRKQRDQLLEKMTDDVAHLVLRDTYLQTQSLSVTEQFGSYLADRLARNMRVMEKAGKLDRAIEFLPDEEALSERLKEGKGFARPELCVLFSYAKNTLYAELAASPLLDDAYLTRELVAYFPAALSERFPEQIQRHRLRREIIATQLSNEIVNRGGLGFVYEAAEKTGMSSAEVVLAYVAAREMLSLKSVWERIERLDNQIAASTQHAMLVECGRLLSAMTVWLLRQQDTPLAVQQEVDTYAAAISELIAHLDEILAPSDREALETRRAHYLESGVPEDLAHRVGSLPFLVSACDLAYIARETEHTINDVGKLYFQIGTRFGFEWLRGLARRLPAERAWDKQAVAAIVDDLYSGQREVTLSVLAEATMPLDLEGLIEGWVQRHRQSQRSEYLLGELRAAANPNFSMLAVAARHLQSLARH